MKRRRWFEIHSWLGVMTGLMLFVICWSGTIAVLSHEIDWLLDARLRVEPRSQVVSWGTLETEVSRAFPDAERMSLQAPLYPGFAAVAIVDTPTQSMQRVYLDPGTGKILGATSYFNVQRFFRSFHMSLFDFGSGKLWGYWFVGSFGLLLLASAIAPLIFYRRWWRGFFTLKTQRGPRVFWSDLHKLIGVWSLLFAFLMAFTGIWYLIEFFDVDLGYPEPPAIKATPNAERPLDDAVDKVKQDWPKLEITAVTPAKGSYWGPVVHVQGEGEPWLVRERANYLLLDQATGDVVFRQSASGVGWPARWVDTADPLHFGDFAGLWSKAIWFVAGLLLSALCLSGAYLHVQRLRAHSDSGSCAWRGTRWALAGSAAVLLIATWGGGKEILSYGPVLDGVRHWPDVTGGVVLFIAGWVVLTILILISWTFFVFDSTRA